MTFLTSLNQRNIPKTIAEALKHPTWKNAMEEMKTLLKNQVWDIVDQKIDTEPARCTLVFTAKYKSNGSLKKI